jgi:myo-inositol-1(or 4)-monophosphatase
VAYASFGKTLAAAIYNPYLDELFHALRGGGAFLNGRPIHASKDSLENSVVCFGTSPYRTDLAEKTFSLARTLFENSLDLRREGTAELDLCSVAAGRAGLYYELWLSLWDYAAGALLVEEAGGVCLTAEGRPLPCTGEKSSVVAAASPAVMKEFLLLSEKAL